MRVRVIAGIGATAVVVAACLGAGIRLPDGAPSASPISLAGTAASTPASTPGVSQMPSATATPARTPALASSTPGMAYDPGTTQVGLPPITNARPLPACAYGDVGTPLTAQADWRVTLVDTQFVLPKTYEPGDLTDPRPAGINTWYPVRALILPDLRAMASAARKAGASLGIASAFRDYHTQIYTFNHWVHLLGPQTALLKSARAGHSEHQLGLAIDFRELGGQDPWLYRDFARETKVGAWLAANAWQFGFVMSYPKGKTGVTCYAYEPWHYRYVGPAAAAAIHNSGQTLREWLWLRQPASASPSASPTVLVP